MDPQPPVSDPPLLADAVSEQPYVEAWRRVLWSVLASIVVAPIVFFPAKIVAELVAMGVQLKKADNLTLVAAILVTAYLTYRFLRRGWSREAGASAGALAGWAVAAFLMVVISHEFYLNVLKMQDAQQRKGVMMNLRQLDDAERRLFAAHPEHPIFTYDDVVGAGREVPQLTSVAGEDYHALYPRHFGQTYCLQISPNSNVRWEILDSTNPPGDWSNPRRYDLPGGGRLETSEDRSREPEGPVRFYRADGRLWVETQCHAGRLIGPVWITGVDGRRTDAFPTGQRHE